MYAAIDILQKTLGKVDGYQSDDGILTHKCAISAVKELSKQKHAAWSEEDERYLNIVSSAIGSPSVQGIYDYHKVNPTDVSDWLKEHIQPQSQWKPSDEQIEILEMVLTNKSMDDNIARILRELREQLKKLKG